ncbi:MAG: hypothetical protein IKM97_03645 [Clostridia bacterium]|nr:hypothetical protein [Clostridia bacterium]
MAIISFKNVTKASNAGGKGASLAKMFQNGFSVPDGFVISADEFDEFLIQNSVRDEVFKLINACFDKSQKEIEENSEKIIEILNNCKMSAEIKKEIIKSYEELNCEYVAVRSSATSEDGQKHAWAGTLETFLNVNKENILETVKKCWQSIFKPRALFYRIKNEKKLEIAVAVVVQKMVQSEISGIAFSINPTTNNENEMVVEAVLGLGESIVSGTVTPDSYIIDKNENRIKNKDIGEQRKELIHINGENVWKPILNDNIQKLDDGKIFELSSTIGKIEKFYGFPIDVEWGIENNKIFILQCRPITTVKENDLANKIKNSGNWQFYVARKFNWFVENTEIYASMGEYQKKLLGFELPTQNYLCLNGDEYALDSDFKIWKDKLDSYFGEDNSFFEKFAKIEFEFVEQIKEQIEHMNNQKYDTLTWNELAEEFESFNQVYINSFISGMTRPEDYLTDRLLNELENLNYKKQDIDNIFSKISTCPNYAPLSYSEEPLDLLKIAKLAKISEKNDIEKIIDEHVRKYAWIKGPVEFEDTCFTKEDYFDRLNNLLDADIDAKIENINNTRKNNDIEYEKVLEQYSFPEKTRKIIKAIRDFIFLRTYTTEYSDHLFFVARHNILAEISRKANIPDQDLIMLSDKEIMEILNNDGKINEKTMNILENRKIGFAMIWLDGDITTIFGKESIELQAEIAKKFKTTSNNIQKENENTISGKIANKGKARGIARILITYEDTYKVNKGDIIVASMTTPDYVSAMEKASGFITDEGGITCHAAILSREFDVPCIVGTVNATEKIKDGEMIELDAYNGKVYKLN